MARSVTGAITAAQAREIGDCAIQAIAAVTGADWDAVFAHARPEFTRYGLNAGGTARTLRALGWTMSPAYELMDLTVAQAEAHLRARDPEARVIATIHVRRTPHSIAYVAGRFHNVQGARRARIGLADRCKPAMEQARDLTPGL